MLTRLGIQRPTILVDAERAQRNIARMAAKAVESGVRFRPHFKTHKSADVGEWFRDAGVEAIAVSSADMAGYFADHGWRDITIAFPVNLLELERLSQLARRVELGLLVETAQAAQGLAEGLRGHACVWIDIDTGYGRDGVPAGAHERVAEVAARVRAARNLTLAGLLTHAGHSYHAPTRQAIADVYRDTVAHLRALRERLAVMGFHDLEISVGDTPTCSVLDRFPGVDEVRPGGFVFYDLRQLQIGSCREDDIAVAVALPVVAKYEDRGELLVYGGAAHLSRDYQERPDGSPTYGAVACWAVRGWGEIVPNAYVASLSQEHGLVKGDAEFMARVQVGDVLPVIPVHSCLLAYHIREYVTLDGKLLRVGGML